MLGEHKANIARWRTHLSDKRGEPKTAIIEKVRSYDLFARCIACLGILFSLASLSWQIFLHHEAETEKISISLMMIHPVEAGEDESSAENKKGWLLFDLANTGSQTVYLKELLLSTCDEETRRRADRACEDTYIYPTAFPNTESIRLDPGASKSFWKKDWDFAKNPIRDCCNHPNAPQYYVRLTSTRGLIGPGTVQTQTAYAHFDEKAKGKKTKH